MTEIDGSLLDAATVAAEAEARAQRAIEEAEQATVLAAANPPGTPPEEQPAEAAAEVPSAPQTYVVQAGDSLSAISEKVYGDAKHWETIFQHNRDKISDPNLLYPGQELTIP